MPTDPLDFWDVQAMVDKGDNAERAARQRHIEDVTRDLRAEFRREVMELREEVGEMLAEVHKRIEHESALRVSDIHSLASTLDARTERFV